MKNGMVEVHGARLYYEVIGWGHPLVLVSGGGCLDRRMWNDQTKPFAERYQVVRYDPRGVGRSTMPEEPFSHEEDLYELLKFLDVDKAYLLGLSFGGGLAVDFAVEHPEMVDALVLASSGLSVPQEEALESLSELSNLSELVREEGLPRVIQMILDSPAYPPPENFAARYKMKELLLENAHIFHSDFSFVRLRQIVHPPASERLSEINAPTLILVGGRDINDIHVLADQLESGITGSKKVVMRGAGHMLNLEWPEEFNWIVLDFLDKL